MSGQRKHLLKIVTAVAAIAGAAAYFYWRYQNAKDSEFHRENNTDDVSDSEDEQSDEAHTPSESNPSTMEKEQIHKLLDDISAFHKNRKEKISEILDKMCQQELLDPVELYKTIAHNFPRDISEAFNMHPDTFENCLSQHENDPEIKQRLLTILQSDDTDGSDLQDLAKFTVDKIINIMECKLATFTEATNALNSKIPKEMRKKSFDQHFLHLAFAHKLRMAFDCSYEKFQAAQENLIHQLTANEQYIRLFHLTESFLS